MTGNLKYDFFGDDLGTIVYIFYNATIAQAVNHSLENTDAYKIVRIKIKRKYWLFGSQIITVMMENPEKIKKLKDTQHYSKSARDY